MILTEFIIRVLVVFIVGSLIGLEREWRGRMTGIRTNALVAVGAQIVSGIGILGGGVIIKNNFGISGLNTAATLWCTAATGVLAGAGYLLYLIIAL